jgi:hypothetical protein
VAVASRANATSCTFIATSTPSTPGVTDVTQPESMPSIRTRDFS